MRSCTYYGIWHPVDPQMQENKFIPPHMFPGHSLCTRHSSKHWEYRSQQNEVSTLKELIFKWEETDNKYVIYQKEGDI